MPSRALEVIAQKTVEDRKVILAYFRLIADAPEGKIEVEGGG